MRKFGLIHPLYLSFYSKELYRDVGKNWGNFAFAYLFVLCLLFTLVMSFYVQTLTDRFFQINSQGILNDVPSISVDKGIFRINRETPYFWGTTEEGKPFLVVDTTGTYRSLLDVDAQVLITEKRMMMNIPARDNLEFDMIMFNDFVIGEEELTEWLRIMEEGLFFSTLPVFFIIILLQKLIELVLYSLFGMVLARLLQVDIRFESILRISIIAFTPITLLEILINLAQIPPTGAISFLSLLLTLGYLGFGIRACKEES